MRAFVFLTTLFASAFVSGASTRSIPSPLTGHPGNVFLAGEQIELSLPVDEKGPLKLSDYDDHVLSRPEVSFGRVVLGALPVGYFRLKSEKANISLAVIAPLKTPTPRTSPVCLDVATAWFYPKDKMEAVASLCALAGVNRVRDRLLWGELEPARGQFVAHTRYDDSAEAQARTGLQVLQVAHLSPAWAAQVTRRFPPDLRDAYNFYFAMARRWRGKVTAFEPWNEADIPMFGGHTGSEMAAMQKACWLGLKAGNPRLTACQNVFALHNPAQLEDFRDNEAWPYFDTFNLHHYAPLAEYPRLYADFRAISGGRPLWVSECALPVKWSGDPELQEPSENDSRVLSERLVKVFACSLNEGAVATFYFLLPHYAEGQTQFGLLHKDLTPRSGYVALAAVGRLLADARPLGRLHDAPAHAQVYGFSARPDGRRAVVLVAWSAQAECDLPLPSLPAEVLDHLGRPLSISNRLHLSAAPVFLVFPKHQTGFNFTPPPAPVPWLPGKPSSIVLQALWPETSIDLERSAYRLSHETRQTLSLALYNFSKRTVSGTLQVSGPAGWTWNCPQKLEDLPPQSRTEVALELEPPPPPPKGEPEPRSIHITGDFGTAGKPVVSFRVIR